MSISSKVLLNTGGTEAYLRLDLDIDFVHISDLEWEFVKALIDRLREYEKAKEPIEAEAEG